MAPEVSLRMDVDRPATSGAGSQTPVKVHVNHLSFYYGQKRALSDISIEIRANVVTAFIGPSGCGKSTFIRTLNRMNDIIPGARVRRRGQHRRGQYLPAGHRRRGLRRRVGMVFQKSNPFPKSIFENVAYGLRINGLFASRARSGRDRSKAACARRRCGTRSRTGCTTPRWRCRADSSSGCASPGRWRSGPRSC